MSTPPTQPVGNNLNPKQIENGATGVSSINHIPRNDNTKIFVLTPSKLQELGLITKIQDGKTFLVPVKKDHASHTKQVTLDVVSSAMDALARTTSRDIVEVPSSSSSQPPSRRRIIHGFAEHWINTIEEKGFVNCPLRNCMYISLSFDDMSEHYSFCKGVPFSTEHVCQICQRCLKSRIDLRIHLYKSHSVKSNEAAQPHLVVDYPSERKVFDERLMVRKRGYNKVHHRAWTISLETNGYVKCHFQNCIFMALDVEEMIEHFRYCQGITLNHLVVCSLCRGGLVSQERLMKHMEISHPEALSRTDLNPSTCMDVKVIADNKGTVVADSTNVPVATSNINMRLNHVPVKSYLSPKQRTSSTSNTFLQIIPKEEALETLKQYSASYESLSVVKNETNPRRGFNEVVKHEVHHPHPMLFEDLPSPTCDNAEGFVDSVEAKIEPCTLEGDKVRPSLSDTWIVCSGSSVVQDKLSDSVSSATSVQNNIRIKFSELNSKNNLTLNKVLMQQGVNLEVKNEVQDLPVRNTVIRTNIVAVGTVSNDIPTAHSNMDKVEGGEHQLPRITKHYSNSKSNLKSKQSRDSVGFKSYNLVSSQILNNSGLNTQNVSEQESDMIANGSREKQLKKQSIYQLQPCALFEKLSQDDIIEERNDTLLPDLYVEDIENVNTNTSIECLSYNSKQIHSPNHVVQVVPCPLLSSSNSCPQVEHSCLNSFQSEPVQANIDLSYNKHVEIGSSSLLDGDDAITLPVSGSVMTLNFAGAQVENNSVHQERFLFSFEDGISQVEETIFQIDKGPHLGSNTPQTVDDNIKISADFKGNHAKEGKSSAIELPQSSDRRKLPPQVKHINDNRRFSEVEDNENIAEMIAMKNSYSVTKINNTGTSKNVLSTDDSCALIVDGYNSANSPNSLILPKASISLPVKSTNKIMQAKIPHAKVNSSPELSHLHEQSNSNNKFQPDNLPLAMANISLQTGIDCLLKVEKVVDINSSKLDEEDITASQSKDILADDNENVPVIQSAKNRHAIIYEDTTIEVDNLEEKSASTIGTKQLSANELNTKDCTSHTTDLKAYENHMSIAHFLKTNKQNTALSSTDKLVHQIDNKVIQTGNKLQKRLIETESASDDFSVMGSSISSPIRPETTNSKYESPPSNEESISDNFYCHIENDICASGTTLSAMSNFQESRDGGRRDIYFSNTSSTEQAINRNDNHSEMFKTIKNKEIIYKTYLSKEMPALYSSGPEETTSLNVKDIHLVFGLECASNSSCINSLIEQPLEAGDTSFVTNGTEEADEQGTLLEKQCQINTYVSDTDVSLTKSNELKDQCLAVQSNVEEMVKDVEYESEVASTDVEGDLVDIDKASNMCSQEISSGHIGLHQMTLSSYPESGNVLKEDASNNSVQQGACMAYTKTDLHFKNICEDQCGEVEATNDIKNFKTVPDCSVSETSQETSSSLHSKIIEDYNNVNKSKPTDEVETSVKSKDKGTKRDVDKLTHISMDAFSAGVDSVTMMSMVEAVTPLLKKDRQKKNVIEDLCVGMEVPISSKLDESLNNKQSDSEATGFAIVEDKLSHKNLEDTSSSTQVHCVGYSLEKASKPQVEDVAMAVQQMNLRQEKDMNDSLQSGIVTIDMGTHHSDKAQCEDTSSDPSEFQATLVGVTEPICKRHRSKKNLTEHFDQEERVNDGFQNKNVTKGTDTTNLDVAPCSKVSSQTQKGKLHPTQVDIILPIRKRGRPKKNLSRQIDQVKDIDTSSHVDEVTQADESVTLDEAQCADILSQNLSHSSGSEITTMGVTQPVRKRGRPKKNVNRYTDQVKDVNDSCHSDVLSKYTDVHSLDESRGRSSQSILQQTESLTSVDLITPVRKRGRPRKKPLQGSSLQTNNKNESFHIASSIDNEKETPFVCASANVATLYLSNEENLSIKLKGRTNQPPLQELDLSADRSLHQTEPESTTPTDVGTSSKKRGRRKKNVLNSTIKVLQVVCPHKGTSISTVNTLNSSSCNDELSPRIADRDINETNAAQCKDQNKSGKASAVGMSKTAKTKVKGRPKKLNHTSRGDEDIESREQDINLTPVHSELLCKRRRLSKKGSPLGVLSTDNGLSVQLVPGLDNKTTGKVGHTFTEMVEHTEGDSQVPKTTALNSESLLNSASDKGISELSSIRTKQTARRSKSKHPTPVWLHRRKRAMVTDDSKSGTGDITGGPAKPFGLQLQDATRTNSVARKRRRFDNSMGDTTTEERVQDVEIRNSEETFKSSLLVVSSEADSGQFKQPVESSLELEENTPQETSSDQLKQYVSPVLEIVKRPLIKTGTKALASNQDTTLRKSSRHRKRVKYSEEWLGPNEPVCEEEPISMEGSLLDENLSSDCQLTKSKRNRTKKIDTDNMVNLPNQKLEQGNYVHKDSTDVKDVVNVDISACQSYIVDEKCPPSEDGEVSEILTSKTNKGATECLSNGSSPIVGPNPTMQKRQIRSERGRWTEANSAGDDEEGGNNSDDNAKDGGDANDSTGQIVPYSKMVIKCGKCGSEIIRKQFAHHNKKKHSGLAWLEGEPAVELSNLVSVKAALCRAWKPKEKKSIACEMCGVVKKSICGFLSHLESVCGKSAEERAAMRVTCEICFRTMMRSSLVVHMGAAHRDPEATQPPEDPELLSEVFEPKPKKRAAAEKAESLLQKFIQIDSSMKFEDPGVVSVESDSPSEAAKELFTVSRDHPKITKSTINRLVKLISQHGFVECRNPDCAFQSSDAQVMVQHWTDCDLKPIPKYFCHICNYITETETSILQHVTENHMIHMENNDESETEQDDDFMEQHVSSEEEEDDESEFYDVCWKPVYKKQSKGVSGSTRKDKVTAPIKFLNVEMTSTVSKDTPYLPALKWTLQFEQDNYSTTLFPSLQTTANDWVLLGPTDADDYLPTTKHSAPLTSYVAGNSSQSQFRNKMKTLKWRSLGLFEADVIDDVPVFFAGGPVWAMAWCPLPSACVLTQQSVSQFLAISCHRNMGDVFELEKTYIGKGLIQIWDFGHMDNLKACGVPSLALGLVHEYGAVWHMDWCPSGAYDEDQPQSSLRRLGLLGVACSDGAIHIFSVPFPSELTGSGTDVPIYKCECLVTLQMGPAHAETGAGNWMCLRFSWYRGKGHEVIAGGFANGVVALWNLCTTSPLLHTRNGKHLTVFPYHTFQAHAGAVTAVSLFPHFNCRYLMTGGFDRATKYWDLHHITAPISTNWKGQVSDGVWLTQWIAGVSSYDDGYGLSHCNAMLQTVRSYAYGAYPLLAQNSPVWSLSSNDWANAIAQGTAAGELMVIFPHQLFYNVDTEKNMKNKRMVISYTELKDFKKEETTSDVKKPLDKKDENLPELKNQSQLVYECEPPASVPAISETPTADLCTTKPRDETCATEPPNETPSELPLLQAHATVVNSVTRPQNETPCSMRVDFNENNALGHELDQKLTASGNLLLKTDCMVTYSGENSDRESSIQYLSTPMEADIVSKNSCQGVVYESGIRNVFSLNTTFTSTSSKDESNTKVCESVTRPISVPMEVKTAEFVSNDGGICEPPVDKSTALNLLVVPSSSQQECNSKEFESVSHHVCESIVMDLVEDVSSKCGTLVHRMEKSEPLNMYIRSVTTSSDEEPSSIAQNVIEPMEVTEDLPSNGESHNSGHGVSPVDNTVIHTSSLCKDHVMHKEHRPAPALGKPTSIIGVEFSASLSSEENNCFVVTNSRPSVITHGNIANDNAPVMVSEQKIDSSTGNFEQVTKSDQIENAVVIEDHVKAEQTKSNEIDIVAVGVSSDTDGNEGVVEISEEIYGSEEIDFDLDDDLDCISDETLINFSSALCGEDDGDSKAETVSEVMMKDESIHGVFSANGDDGAEKLPCELSSEDKTINKETEVSADAELLPDSYEGVSDRFGLHFFNYQTNDWKKLLPEARLCMRQSDKMRPVDMEMFPLTSINRVTWNPNVRSFLWLASGHHCGLVRVPCIRAMHTYEVEKNLQRTAAEFKSGK